MRIRRRDQRDIPYRLGIEIPSHLNNRDKPPPHPLSRRVSNICFFPPNTTDALSKKGKSAVGAPCNGRQSVDVDTPDLKGKSTFGAPSMKGKSVDLPREGKR